MSFHLDSWKRIIQKKNILDCAPWKHTLENQGPMTQDNENKQADDIFVVCPDRRPNTSRQWSGTRRDVFSNLRSDREVYACQTNSSISCQLQKQKCR